MIRGNSAPFRARLNGGNSVSLSAARLNGGNGAPFGARLNGWSEKRVGESRHEFTTTNRSGVESPATGSRASGFGRSPVSGMNVSCVYKLRQALGLDKPGTPVKVVEPYQMLGEIAPDLQDALGIDVVGLGGPNTMFGFPLAGLETLDHLRRHAGAGAGRIQHRSGAERRHPHVSRGGQSVPPSGRMPKGGFYFDSIIRQDPIDDDKLNVEDNLEEFGPVSDAVLQHFASEADRLRRESDRAILANSAARPSATSPWCPARG